MSNVSEVDSGEIHLVESCVTSADVPRYPSPKPWLSGFPIVRSDYQSGRSGPSSPTTLTGRSKVLDGLPGTVQLFGRTVWTTSPMLKISSIYIAYLGLGVGLKTTSFDLALALALD